MATTSSRLLLGTGSEERHLPTIVVTIPASCNLYAIAHCLSIPVLPTWTPPPLDPTLTPVPFPPGHVPTLAPTLTPTPAPIPVPEPLTVVLFGAGLASLTAYAASRRR